MPLPLVLPAWPPLGAGVAVVPVFVGAGAVVVVVGVVGADGAVCVFGRAGAGAGFGVALGAARGTGVTCVRATWRVCARAVLRCERELALWCVFVIPACLPWPRVSANCLAAAPLDPPLAGVNPCALPEALRWCLPAAERDDDPAAAVAAAAAAFEAPTGCAVPDVVWPAPAELSVARTSLAWPKIGSRV